MRSIRNRSKIKMPERILIEKVSQLFRNLLWPCWRFFAPPALPPRRKSIATRTIATKTIATRTIASMASPRTVPTPPARPIGATVLARRARISARLAQEGYRLIGPLRFDGDAIIAFGVDAEGRRVRFAMDPYSARVLEAQRLRSGEPGERFADRGPNEDPRWRSRPDRGDPPSPDLGPRRLGPDGPQGADPHRPPVVAGPRRKATSPCSARRRLRPRSAKPPPRSLRSSRSTRRWADRPNPRRSRPGRRAIRRRNRSRRSKNQRLRPPRAVLIAPSSRRPRRRASRRSRRSRRRSRPKRRSRPLRPRRRRRTPVPVERPAVAEKPALTEKPPQASASTFPNAEAPPIVQSYKPPPVIDAAPAPDGG